MAVVSTHSGRIEGGGRGAPPLHARSSEPVAGRPAVEANLSFGLTVATTATKEKNFNGGRHADKTARCPRRRRKIATYRRFYGHGGRKVAEWAWRPSEELQRICGSTAGPMKRLLAVDAN